jgi:hypothetical protein
MLFLESIYECGSKLIEQTNGIFQKITIGSLLYVSNFFILNFEYIVNNIYFLSEMSNVLII